MSKKLISYALFKGSDELAEIFYIRGFYFNCLMNRLVYPGWQTVCYVDKYMYSKYGLMFGWLKDVYGVKAYSLPTDDYTHCERMLIRISPCFWEDVERVICRDADALTSYREAQAVHEWEQTDNLVHSIHDNKAHTVPLMGGLIGFVAKSVVDRYISFTKMINLSPVKIAEHGTDQDFLTRVIFHDMKYSTMLHNFKGSYDESFHMVVTATHDVPPPNVKKELWLSDLCSSFVGAAGFNEMETLRFFKAFLPDFKDDSDLWNKYPKIFYWYE